MGWDISEELFIGGARGMSGEEGGQGRGGSKGEV